MNLEKIENRLKVIDYHTDYDTRDSHFLHAACRDLIAEVKLTSVELETLKKEYAIDKAIWEREKTDLEAEVKFRTGQVEEKCLTIDSLTGQLASANEAICGMKKGLEYLADESHWDEEEGMYKLQRPGGGGQQGIFLISRNLNPWLFAQNALSSAPVCPHKEEAEGLKKELYEFQKESVAVAARNLDLSGQLAALRAELDDAKEEGAKYRLIMAGESATVNALRDTEIEAKDATIAALQAALDEERGKRS